MNVLIDTLKSWMATHAPQVLQALNPPASDTEIAHVEQVTGLPIPESLKLFLYQHNGESSDSWLALLGDGQQLLSCEAIIQQYQWGQEIAASVSDPSFDTLEFWKDRVNSGVIAVKGPVKPLINHPHWLPISCMNGDVFRYLDFAPAPGGHKGQVIEVDPEGCAYQVLAPDFETYLANYILALKGNRYTIDEAGYIESREQDPMDWGVPEWLKE